MTLVKMPKIAGTSILFPVVSSGSGLGILIGALMDNIGLGLCLGICTGMCVGLAAGSFGRCRNDRALRNRKGTSDGEKKSNEK